MDYRREIDGLRALAVLPVILFHAGFQTFSGGFVGVDVFFVISGYLITTIILAELEQGKFSIINFYERRARRILPALFVVMFACLPFAWLWLLPQDMSSFSQSLMAVSVFASNVLFWKTSGYFDTAAELKPLLHTWSLAVEEQYYLFFPVFLALTWRLGKRWILALLGVAFVLSLATAQWGSVTFPLAAFFLLPTRGWELLVGAFVAFYFSRYSNKSLSRGASEIGSFVGVSLIIYSIVVFDEQTPFPSLYTLVPTVGTALVILCATKGAFMGKLLGNSVFVGVGLISYSAYLWHQPLFAFAKHRSVNGPSHLLLGALALIALILAFFTWKYVEAPFRDRRRFDRKNLFLLTAIASIFFIAAGLAGHLNEGFKDYFFSHRATPNQKISYGLYSAAIERKAFLYKDRARYDNGECRMNVENLTSAVSDRLLSCYKRFGKGVAILGDSHAINLYGSLSFVSKHYFLIGVTKIGCHLPKASPQCQYDEFLEFIKTNPTVFAQVIYETAGYLLLRTKDNVNDARLLANLGLSEKVVGVFPDEKKIDGVLDYLVRIGAFVPVLWFGPRIEPHIGVRDVLRLSCDAAYALRPNQLATYKALDTVISAKMLGRSNVYFLSQNEVYKFDFSKDFMNCKDIFWADGSHLSEAGEKYFGSRFNVLDFRFR